MKRNLFTFLIATLILSGCQKEDIYNEKEMRSSLFYATLEGNGTKTSLDDQGNVLCKQGNQVSIFNGNTTNEKWQVTDDSDGKTSASLYQVTSSSSDVEFDNNVAFYPYASTNSIEKNGADYNIGITLPSTQDYLLDGSFGDGAFPMAAITSLHREKKIEFKNILGALKLQLQGTAIVKSITVTGNNNEILCGAGTVTASISRNPSISLTDESSTTVTLNCGEGVQLKNGTATSFVIALPPMTMSGGFTVLIQDSNGKVMKKVYTSSKASTSSIEIERSKISKVPSFECNPSSFIFPFSVSSKTIVQFSHGNLYCTLDAVPSYHFESNQYDYRHLRTLHNDKAIINGVSTTTPEHTIGSFRWGDILEAVNVTTTTPGGNFFATSDLSVQGSSGKWRALTNSEWNYLLLTRKVTVNGAQKAPYGEGVVNGVNGLIILPDTWDGSACSTFTYGTSQWGNTFTESTWSAMEAAGCVFLPASGTRDGEDILSTGLSGAYWSSTPYDADASKACLVYFFSGGISGQSATGNRCQGVSIRLVQE